MTIFLTLLVVIYMMDSSGYEICCCSGSNEKHTISVQKIVILIVAEKGDYQYIEKLNRLKRT